MDWKPVPAEGEVLDLSLRSYTRLVPLPRAADGGFGGVRVCVKKLLGSWTTPTVSVMVYEAGDYVDFTSAKSIAAGGGSVSISRDEVRGVACLAVRLVGTPEATGNLAVLTVLTDELREAAGGVAAGVGVATVFGVAGPGMPGAGPPGVGVAVAAGPSGAVLGGGAV